MSEPDLAAILDSVTEAGAEAPAVEATPEPSQNMTSPPETPAAEEAPPAEAPKEPDHFDRSWAAIKAAEKRNLAERTEVKEQRRQMESMKAQMDSMKAELDRYQGGFRENPVDFLEKQGMTFDDLAKRVLNDGAQSPEELIRRNSDRSSSEIQQLRQEVAQQREMIQEQNNDRYVREYQKDVRSVIQSEEFELLRDYPDSETLIFNLASLHASDHGEVLTPTDAARRIQSELTEQLKSLSQNEAVRRLLGLQDAPEKTKSAVVPATSNPGEQSKPQTLTNALAATPAAEVPDMSKMSEYELLREAAKLIPSDTWTD
jgi:hypothetical protein